MIDNEFLLSRYVVIVVRVEYFAQSTRTFAIYPLPRYAVNLVLCGGLYSVSVECKT